MRTPSKQGPDMKHIVPCLALTAAVLAPLPAHAACCYFSAKNADILQPSQKAFLQWDPVEKVEAFTVQPRFEGNALDFGMVIPTPTQPKLHEMPRDFFKHLAVYTILKKRESPVSKLVPSYPMGGTQRIQYAPVFVSPVMTWAAHGVKPPI